MIIQFTNMRLKEKKYKEKREKKNKTKKKTGGDLLNGVFLCCLFSHEMFRKGFPTYFFKKRYHDMRGVGRCS